MNKRILAGGGGKRGGFGLGVGSPLVRNLENVYTASQFSYIPNKFGAITDIPYGTIMLKAWEFSPQTFNYGIMVSPVPHSSWDKNVVDLDVAIINLVTPLANFDKCVIGAKIYAEPDGTDVTGHDFSNETADQTVTLTMLTGGTQYRAAFFSLPINRITAAPLNHHGVFYILFWRVTNDANDTYINNPVYCPFINFETFLQ